MKRIFPIILLSILSGQWSGGTATSVDVGRKEVGLFSPFRMGLNNGSELIINKFVLMPSIGFKQEQIMFGNWERARTVRVEYPTMGMKWLQSPLGMELGEPDMFALISPQFTIPQMVSFHGEWMGTRPITDNSTLTLRGGFGFSLGGDKLSNDATIDLPIIYPRLSVYYNGTVFTIGGEYASSFRPSWSYSMDYDMIMMPGGRGRYAFEHKGLMVWTKSPKFQIHFGYKLIAGEYPFGAQAHLFPALDFIWRSDAKHN